MDTRNCGNICHILFMVTAWFILSQIGLFNGIVTLATANHDGICGDITNCTRTLCKEELNVDDDESSHHWNDFVFDVKSQLVLFICMFESTLSLSNKQLHEKRNKTI